MLHGYKAIDVYMKMPDSYDKEARSVQHPDLSVVLNRPTGSRVENNKVKSTTLHMSQHYT